MGDTHLLKKGFLVSNPAIYGLCQEPCPCGECQIEVIPKDDVVGKIKRITDEFEGNSAPLSHFQEHGIDEDEVIITLKDVKIILKNEIGDLK